MQNSIPHNLVATLSTLKYYVFSNEKGIFRSKLGREGGINLLTFRKEEGKPLHFFGYPVYGT